MKIYARPIRWFVGISCLTLLVLILLALYRPFLHNPVLFDDHGLFTTAVIFNVAQHIFSPYSRTFPYFSLGLVHVLGEGDLSWNRWVSMVLHGLVVVVLYFFLCRATRRVESPSTGTRQIVLLLTALWVAIHPVAVYGAAYLVQRTILFATLFALVSALLYLRAQQEERDADLFSAALLAALSMLSKEHALLLPVAVVILTPLICPWNRTTLRRAAVYLALSLPCTTWLAMNVGKGAGAVYEPYGAQLLSQAASPSFFDFPGGTWAMSIATQLLLFWEYLFLWLIPNPQWMSIDLRVDFPAIWSSVWAFAALATSIFILLAAAVCWLRPATRRLTQQYSAILLFAAIPFAVELSVVRVQEPFVLYRSYLWMPAYALLLCFFCLTCATVLEKRDSRWPLRAFFVLMALLCGGLFPLAQDRLQSFSSEDAVWQDALRKLPHPDVAGAGRIYHSLSSCAVKRKDFDTALHYAEKVVAQNPGIFQGYLARGEALLGKRELEAALQAFREAERLTPESADVKGFIVYKQCNILELCKEYEAMAECLYRAARLGDPLAASWVKSQGIVRSP